MLQSFVESKEDVEKILISKRQSQLLVDVDMIAITELIKFLTPFEDVTNQLQGDHHPT